MVIGKMRDKVSVYQEVTTPDGMGGETAVLNLKGIYWAEVTAMGGDKDDDSARQAYRVRMRNNGIKIKDVIVFRGGTITIQSVLDSPKNDIQTITGWLRAE